jgi:hypothetical protein
MLLGVTHASLDHYFILRIPYAISAMEIASYYHIHRSKGKNQLAIQLQKLPDDKECESYTLDARQTELQLKKKSI